MGNLSPEVLTDLELSREERLDQILQEIIDQADEKDEEEVDSSGDEEDWGCREKGGSRGEPDLSENLQPIRKHVGRGGSHGNDRHGYAR